MTEPKPPKKRVVSKPEYLARLVLKKTLDVGSALLWIGGILCSIPIILLGLATCFLFGSHLFAVVLTGTCVWIAIGASLMLGGVLTEKAFKKIETGLPPTRQSMEELPAEETLLRASEEPSEGQEKVLLRAATGVEDTPSEQLLRPGNIPD